ncbi:MAG: major facilitator superfamily 1 [Anaerocolumna sp.]|nr:major facilitator superfamily 1 [Anaerocolumna sp.]
MKLNYKRTILIGLAFFSICSFWQLYDSVIPMILSKTFGLKETTTGAIMALDNVLALFLLPLFGAFSDRTNTRIGKRTPYIIVGTIISIIFMLLIPIADNSANFVLFFISLGIVLLAMGTYRSPAVALMPDVTPKPLRSKANAIINLMGTLGAVYSLVMISKLVPKVGKPDYSNLFITVAALMIVSIVIMVITIRENALVKANEEVNARISQESIATDNSMIHQAMPPEVKRSLVLILSSVFLWFTAYNAVTTAFSRYAVNVWGFEGGSYANALLVATIAATLSYVPIGFISSHIGRKKTILIGIVIITISYFCAFLFDTYSPIIYIIFAFTGIGWASINVNSYPMVVEMSRGCDVGKYTGLYYTFSMAAQILTPIISGALLENVSYRTLFPYAVIFSLLSLSTMLFVKHGDAKPPKKNTLENFDIED